MSCKDCEARRKMARDALLRSAVGETVKQLSFGAAEMVGLKQKTAKAEAAKAEADAIIDSGDAGKQTVPEK